MYTQLVRPSCDQICLHHGGSIARAHRAIDRHCLPALQILFILPAFPVCKAHQIGLTILDQFIVNGARGTDLSVDHHGISLADDPVPDHSRQCPAPPQGLGTQQNAAGIAVEPVAYGGTENNSCLRSTVSGHFFTADPPPVFPPACAVLIMREIAAKPFVHGQIGGVRFLGENTGWFANHQNIVILIQHGTRAEKGIQLLVGGKVFIRLTFFVCVSSRPAEFQDRIVGEKKLNAVSGHYLLTAVRFFALQCDVFLAEHLIYKGRRRQRQPPAKKFVQTLSALFLTDQYFLHRSVSFAAIRLKFPESFS